MAYQIIGEEVRRDRKTTLHGKKLQQGWNRGGGHSIDT
jgi:hypothetical protein